jgi:hypothetical protein
MPENRAWDPIWRTFSWKALSSYWDWEKQRASALAEHGLVADFDD